MRQFHYVVGAQFHHRLRRCLLRFSNRSVPHPILYRILPVSLENQTLLPVFQVQGLLE
jgi:hypothetical protein